MHEPIDDRLTWILGSSRSGSTWLLGMLRATGEIVAIDDPHLGHHLGVWRPISIGFATSEEDPELTTLSDVKREKDDYFFSDRYADAWRPALRDLIAARFAAQARDVSGETGAPIVVKEPASQKAELLLSLFPRCRLIFLLRDGRDVVDSWLDAYTQGSWAQHEGAFPAARAKRLPLIRWLASVWVHRTEAVQRAYAGHDPDRRLLVRYEQLLADPGEQLRLIAGLLDLDLDQAVRERIVEAQRFEAVAPGERGNGKEVRQARPGGWRENLSSRERAAMTAVMEAKLAEVGYDVDHRGGRRRPLAA